MSVASLSAPGRYRVWDPTRRQTREPDTLYLMDITAEALLSPLEGGWLGANEAFGTADDAPPWRGGNKVAVVPGKYRPGLRALGTSNNFLHLPLSGVLPTDEWSIEFFVKSSLPWASLSNALSFRLLSEFATRITVNLNAGTVQTFYGHQQDPSAFVSRQGNYTGHNLSAGQWASVALTLTASTVRTYLDKTLIGTLTGCLPPRSWADNWTSGVGLAVSIETPQITVSDLRISRLARVPGEAPA